MLQTILDWVLFAVGAAAAVLMTAAYRVSQPENRHEFVQLGYRFLLAGLWSLATLIGWALVSFGNVPVGNPARLSLLLVLSGLTVAALGVIDEAAPIGRQSPAALAERPRG